jgi:lipopolysaccharide export system protein LptC
VGSLTVLAAAGVTATDRIVVAIGLILIMAVALVVFWAYRGNAREPKQRALARRQWTVIKGGKKHERVFRPKSGTRSARRGSGS